MDVVHARSIVEALLSRCAIPSQDWDDARQEGYLAILQHPDRKPYRAAWNRLCHFRRDEARARRRLLRGPGQPESVRYNMDKVLDLQDALMALSASERDLTLRHFWAGLSWADIAKERRCRRSQVETDWFEVKVKLRQQLI
jgi:DNA-directed RNA polymerase specialized sigma24 family protein